MRAAGRTPDLGGMGSAHPPERARTSKVGRRLTPEQPHPASTRFGLQPVRQRERLRGGPRNVYGFATVGKGDGALPGITGSGLGEAGGSHARAARNDGLQRSGRSVDARRHYPVSPRWNFSRTEVFTVMPGRKPNRPWCMRLGIVRGSPLLAMPWLRALPLPPHSVLVSTANSTSVPQPGRYTVAWPSTTHLCGRRSTEALGAAIPHVLRCNPAHEP